MKTPGVTFRIATLAAAGVLTLSAAGIPDARAESGSRLHRADLDRLGRAIARDEVHVTAEQLTKWLVEERKDYVLVDVRSPKEFEEGHIKGATNIALPDLLKTETLAKLPRDKAIVLYSNVTDHAAQAAVVLQLAGLNALSLQGGFEHWVRYTLEPQKAGSASGEQLDAARREAIARHLKECPPCLAAPPGGYVPPMTPVAPGGPARTRERAGGGPAPKILEGGC
jgi:rhodanese-related sulfurtransferase